jgi:hypothetical protein
LRVLDFLEQLAAAPNRARLDPHDRAPAIGPGRSGPTLIRVGVRRAERPKGPRYWTQIGLKRGSGAGTQQRRRGKCAAAFVFVGGAGRDRTGDPQTASLPGGGQEGPGTPCGAVLEGFRCGESSPKLTRNHAGGSPGGSPAGLHRKASAPALQGPDWPQNQVLRPRHSVSRPLRHRRGHGRVAHSGAVSSRHFLWLGRSLDPLVPGSSPGRPTSRV